MSKDIRNFFVSKSKPGASNKSPSKAASATKKRTNKRILSSDDEKDDSQSPKRPKVKSKAGKTHILSDSDDDCKEVAITESSTVPKTSEKRKYVSVSNYFGNSPVLQVPSKKVKSRILEKDVDFENDVDFLAEIDQLESSYVEEAVKVEKKHGTPEKPKTDVTDRVDESNEKKDTNGDTKLQKHHKLLDESSSSRSSNAKKESEKKNDVGKESRVKREKASPSEHETKKKNKTIASKIVVDETTNKKRKHSDETKDADVFEEIIEKKKQKVALYQQYLNRGGARNPGSKEIPKGGSNCLAGLSFLITGVLDSLERDEAAELIKEYGGNVLQQVSKKTNYVVLGDEPGPAKLKKAHDLKIPTISEDELLDLIRTRPAGRESKISGGHNERKKPPITKTKQPSPEPEPLIVKSEPVAPAKRPVTTGVTETTEKIAKDESSVTDHGRRESNAWVDKYSPKSVKQIIGQQGDKSNAKKLLSWLTNWFKNQDGNVKHAKPSPWAKNDDGAFFKAALLSGPPGVGKTTTVQLVCKTLGLDALEFNASDTRSKRLLKEEVSELLSNKSMKGYFVGEKSEGPGKRHVLVMDEVDGMAGNEDRGGLQELIALIKSTSVPIICICNDRNHPKMRTLANYTFDLRFQKPRVEQIRAAMMSVCYKENVNIEKEDLDKLIQSTDNDVRQVLNQLSMISQDSSGDGPRKDVKKDLKLGPWDVVRKVFTREEHKNMSIHDKSDLFFHDYNISGLFVQENYVGVAPHGLKGVEVLEAVAKSAYSLALGDMVENSIRRNGAWSLLPTQAIFSSVIPGSLMSGHVTRQIAFPTWLGQNSRRGKFDRLLQDITVHTRLATSASKDSINLDYLRPLRDAIVGPLATDGSGGAEQALNVMRDYHLLREDLDSLIEVSLWPGDRDPMQSVESKVKAAFTRLYNKSSMMIPYAAGDAAKKKKTESSTDESSGLPGLEGEEEENQSEEDDDSIENNAMIKQVKKTSTKKASAASTTGTSTSKKGQSTRGKGKGKK